MTDDQNKVKLEDIGVIRKESHAWQKMGKLSDAELLEKLRREQGLSKDDKTPPDDDAA